MTGKYLIKKIKELGINKEVVYLEDFMRLEIKDAKIENNKNLYVIKHPSAVSMLIELCFVDTQSDVDKYNLIGVEAIANAIVSGLTGQTVSTSSGKLEWIQDKDKWYWLKSDCRMAQSETLHINNKEYSFNDRGEMI